MWQYLTMTSQVINGKNGEIVSVIPFRGRQLFPESMIYHTSYNPTRLLRIDEVVYSLYGSIYKAYGVIDVNEKDVFSFASNEDIFAVDKGSLIR